MAIKASNTITLASVTDVDSITPYYLSQTATLSPPSKPTSNPPPSSWVSTEPQFDYSKTLYTTMLIVYSNGTWEYSDVSTVSEYEASKAAYNKAQSAEQQAQQTNQYFWMGTGAELGAHITEVPQEQWSDQTHQNYHKGGNLLAESNSIAVRDGLTELATFDANGVNLYKNGDNIAQFGSDIRIGGTSENLTLSSSPYGYNMSFKYDSNIRGQISIRQYDMSLVSIGTNGFIGSGINLSCAGSGNGRYGRISMTINEENGDGFYLNITPKGLYTQGKAKVLWSGGSTGKYMTDTQSVELNETISEQLNGIMLVWSRYANGTTYNDSWSYDFIPKWHVIYHDGGGVYCSMPMGLTSTTVCKKYVYIHELSMAGPANITGHADNAATGTGYANNARVLRAVLGV